MPDAIVRPGADEAPSTGKPPLEAVPVALPERDVRRKRPPLLTFFLRMETLRRGLRVGALLAIDYTGVFAAIFTALALKAELKGTFDQESIVAQTEEIVAFAYLITVLLFARSNLYADRARRPGLTRIVGSLFQVMVVALLFAVADGDRFSSYYIFYGSLFFAVVYVSSLRYGWEKLTGLLLRSAGYRRRAIVVGTGRTIDEVGHAFADSPRSAIDLIGYIATSPRPDNGLRSLGRLEDLSLILDRHKPDEVIIADHDFPEERAVELVDLCHQRGVAVRVAPSTMEILVHRAEFIPGQSVPLFEIKPPVFEGFDFFVKRTFDLVMATLLLVVLSPVLLAIALAVRLSSRGPIIYRSIRPGIGGAPFACFKFRTMLEHADQMQADLESLNEAGGAIFKIKDDPRMTRIGRFLRRFSLDELPQLANVLKGDMSLVGPRPLPLRDFERLEDWHKKRYLVLPGVTGLWQVSGRSELDFDDLVRLDFLYLERWSVVFDLVILIKTIPAVFARRGAF